MAGLRKGVISRRQHRQVVTKPLEQPLADVDEAVRGEAALAGGDPQRPLNVSRGDQVDRETSTRNRHDLRLPDRGPGRCGVVIAPHPGLIR
jgi:hypothetical protein